MYLLFSLFFIRCVGLFVGVSGGVIAIGVNCNSVTVVDRK